jgi:hypothetical protein
MAATAMQAAAIKVAAMEAASEVEAIAAGSSSHAPPTNGSVSMEHACARTRCGSERCTW